MQRSLCVLVVEDEMLIATVAEMILAEQGHAVLLARGRADALAAAERRTRIDLAIVDLQLRDGSGAGVIAGLRAARPGLPVVISTGYALGAAERGALNPLRGRTIVLRKPWSEAGLLGAVAEATGTIPPAPRLILGADRPPG